MSYNFGTAVGDHSWMEVRERLEERRSERSLEGQISWMQENTGKHNRT